MLDGSDEYDGPEVFAGDDPNLYYVVSHWLRCPRCQNPWLDRKRTDDNGDRSKTRKFVCPQCGAKVHEIVVGWPPQRGKVEHDTP